MSNEPLTPVDVIALLWRRWPTIMIAATLGAGAALTYAFLTPEWFSATLTVVPSQPAQDSAAGLAAKLPFAIDAVPTNVQRIDAVLTSTSVADEVIGKFGLLERYDTSHIEHARQALWQHCVSSVNRKSSIVSLSCEDKDPAMAMAMARYFGEVGNRVFGRISASSAREERRFLETQVTKARTDVEDASQKLRAFQEAHKIIDLPEQSKAVISAMATLKGEMLSKQLELSYLTNFSSQNESSVVQLEQQISIMNAKLGQLEAAKVVEPAAGSAARPDDKSEFFPSAMNVPELRLQLEHLIREQKITETVFFLMTQRYELAKVDEARDTSTFQILDQPTLPTYKSRPQRLRLGLLGLLVGVAAGCTLVLLRPLLERAKASRR